MPVGYHGTLEVRAESILNGGKFIHSSKKTEWLGSGVYFFKHKGYAIWWANEQVKHKPKTKKGEKNLPAVLRADLVFTEDQLLDLDDPLQLDLMNEFIDEYIRLVPGYNNIWNRASDEERWCLACNLYRRINTKIKVICLTFHVSTPKNRENTGKFPKSQFQYCISDDSIINNIKKEDIDYEAQIC